MRSLLALALALSLIAGAATVLPARAHGAVAVGIADSESSTFTSPWWNGPSGYQNVVRLRVIVPYDIAARPSSDTRRQQFEDYLRRFAAFRSSHPDATLNVGLQRITDSNIAGYGQAPSEDTYRRDFAIFRFIYNQYVPYMRIDPWNEPNFNPGNGSAPKLPNGSFLYESGGGCDSSSPTVNNCGPRLAAYYYRWARVDCPDCNLEAGDFAGTTRYDYIQKYKYHLGSHRPDVWAVHNYSDVYAYQINSDHNATELKSMLGEIFCTTRSTAGYDLGPQHCSDYGTNWTSGNLWVTATGAAYSFDCWRVDGTARHPSLNCAPSEPYRIVGETSQCNGAAFIMRFGNIDSRITRAYYYTYMDPNYNNLAADDETGLVNGTGTTPRKAYKVIRDRAQSCVY